MMPEKTRNNARAKRSAAAPTVGDVYAALDAFAPFRNAASWDNVGLLAGRLDWPASHGLLALDLTDAVADEAIRTRANLLIVYHPPIFKGLMRITPEGEATSRLPDLLARKTSILALHTALDAAPGGTNDVLLDPFDLVERRPLTPIIEQDQHLKLVVFVPGAEAARLRTALSAAGAGVVGGYAECSYELDGRGTFRGGETTTPSIGERGALEMVPETRLEMVVPKARVAEVVRALYQNHSYEEPAFDLYPLHGIAGRGVIGMGRIGVLRRPMRGAALTAMLAEIVDLRRIRVVGNLKRLFRSVTTAAGSFGVDSFRDPESLVITGEFKHHDALALLRRSVTALHLGHDDSERPVLARVRAHLQRNVPGLRIGMASGDRSPFQLLTH